MNSFQKMIVCGLTLVTVGGASTPVTTALANDIKTTSSVRNTKSSEFKINQLAQEYKGVSLSKVNFDKSKMSERQLELYNKLLAIQYEQASEQGTTNGQTRDQYISNLDNQLQGPSIQLRNGGHGLISTAVVATTANFIINAALIASGYGTVSTMVKALGKDAAKEFVKKNIIQKLEQQLGTWGIKFGGALAGQAVDKIIGTLLDPGKAFADWLDSIDKIPNNGYIEWT